jgi:transcriptional regulator with XRE-family HTH domain
MPIDLVVEPLNKRVRQAIRAEMARIGVSQMQLAMAMGRTQNWVSYRLTGKAPLTLEAVEDISKALALPIDYLLLPESPRRRRAS